MVASGMTRAGAWAPGSSRRRSRGRRLPRGTSSVVRKVHDSTYRELTPITFKAYAVKWLDGLGGLKPSTVRDYRSVIEHALIPSFGDRPLVSLTVDDANALLAKRADVLKPRTLTKYLTILHKLLDDAVESGHLSVNRLHKSRALRRPKALKPEDEGEVEVLDAAEVNRLLDAVDGHYAPLYVTLVSTGMRLGEALGLQWGDIARGGRQIRVNRTLYRGTYYLPKSKRSKRAIDVGDQVLAALRVIERERQADAPLEAPVFVTSTGSLV